MGTSINSASLMAQNTGVTNPVPVQGGWFDHLKPKAEPSPPEVNAPARATSSGAKVISLTTEEVKGLNRSWSELANASERDSAKQFLSAGRSFEKSKLLAPTSRSTNWNREYVLLKDLPLGPGVSIPKGSVVRGPMVFPEGKDGMSIATELYFDLPNQTRITFSPSIHTSSGLGATKIHVKDLRSDQTIYDQTVAAALFFNEKAGSLNLISGSRKKAWRLHDVPIKPPGV